MHPAARSRAIVVAAALAIVYVVWGSTYLGIAVGLETLPPLLLAAVRFTVAGALLYLVAIRLGDRVGDRPGGRQWLAALLTGIPLLVLGNAGVVWAQQSVPSGVAALLVATVPLWIAVLDRVGFGNRLTWRAVVGLVLGFGGIALLVNPGGGDVDLLGAAIVVLAAACWATGTLVARGAALPRRPLVAAAMQMLAGGAVLVVASAVAGELGDVDTAALSGRSLLALAYLIVFGSIVAFSAYGWLLRATRTSLVATYAYVNPVVAVLLGWAVLGEAIAARTLVAGGIIVVAVALIVSAPAAARRERPRSTVPARMRTAGRSSAAWATRGR